MPSARGSGKNSKQNLCKLLKTHIKEMSTFFLSAMLLKTNELRVAFHDVDEKKGSY